MVVCASAWNPARNATSLLHCEAQAIMFRLDLVQQINLENIWFEIDCLGLVPKLNSDWDDPKFCCIY